MTQSKYPCNAIILAAGNSTRMNKDKALLAFDSEHNFLDQLLYNYTAICDKVLLVINERLNKGLTNYIFPDNVYIIVNTKPEKGRNYSIFLGISKLANSYPTFLQNIDNPFTDKTILTSLLLSISSYDYCYPSYFGKGGHPILISQKIQKAFLEKYRDDMHFRDFLIHFTRTSCPVIDDKYSLNINTKKEYLNNFGLKNQNKSEF